MSDGARLAAVYRFGDDPLLDELMWQDEVSPGLDLDEFAERMKGTFVYQSCRLGDAIRDLGTAVVSLLTAVTTNRTPPDVGDHHRA